MTMKSDVVYMLLFDDHLCVRSSSTSVEYKFGNGQRLEEYEVAIGKAVSKHPVRAKSKLALGLPSRHFYFWASKSDKPSGSSSLQETKYLLEESLPIDAEDMAICELAGNASIVLDKGSLSPLMSNLFTIEGVKFDWVFPTSLLVGELLVRHKKTSNRIIRDATSADLIEGEGEKISSWQYFPRFLDDAASLPSGADVASANPAEVQLESNLPKDLAVSREELLEKHLRGQKALNLIRPFDFAEQVNSHFGITESADNGWQSILLAAAMSLLLVAGGLAWRANDIRSQAANFDDQTRAGFKDLFPEKRINAPVQRLLKVELENAKQLNQLVKFSDSNAKNLGTLQATLAAFPTSIRCQVDSVEIIGDRLTIRGKVKSLADLETLRRALESGGFEIGTDSSYAVDFVLFLKRNAAPLAAGGIS